MNNVNNRGNVSKNMLYWKYKVCELPLLKIHSIPSVKDKKQIVNEF